MKIPPAEAAICGTSFCEDESKRKPLIKPDFVRLDALGARYYPAVYNFASRLVDEPWEAALLTQLAFVSIRKQAWQPRDETALIRILFKAVVRLGLKAT